MAAHSFEANRTELLRLIAFHANWDPNTANWTDEWKLWGYDILNEALLQFYFPSIIDNDRSPHEWRFLWVKESLDLVAPYSTGTIGIAADAGGSIVTLTSGTWPSWAQYGDLWVDGSRYSVKSRTSDAVILLDDIAVTLASGADYSLIRHEYDLPDDFTSNSCQGFTYRRDQTEHGRIPIVSEASIRRYDRDNSSGPARCAAIMPRSTNDATESTRWSATFWPIPSQNAVVDYVYRATPPMISALNASDHLYVYGGPAHMLTIKKSIEDITYQKIHRSEEKHAAFLEQLRRSVALDRRHGQVFSRGRGVKSLAPDGPAYDEALREWRSNSPEIHDNINFG